MLKVSTVLRTKVPGLKTNAGTAVPTNARVLVMSSARVSAKEGRDVVKVQVRDPALPDLTGQWFVAAPGAFRPTRAGNPWKDKQ